MDKLTDLNFIKKNTPNINELKVVLKKTNKGISLFSKDKIKKGNIVAYYKFKVYDWVKHNGKFKDMYHFTVYTKSGNGSNKFIGDLYEGSLDNPRRNIPFWGYFSNEPSGKQKANSYIDENLSQNYRNRDRVKKGDTMIYKLVASKDISPGEEITWCYGEDYIRNYKNNC